MGGKVLIVGGVAGGAGTAARLRRLDESAKIILFERGQYISYANCGLPYYIGGAIPDRRSLFVTSEEQMRRRFNVDVRIRQEVIEIDRQNKQVFVQNHCTGEVYAESYDTLVLATGSSPLKPPIPGIGLPGIFQVWTIPDTDAIKAYLEEKHPKRAAVIGGGFIGLEMAENLKEAGLDVTIVEMQGQVLSTIDYEMARLLQENIIRHGVTLQLGRGVEKFTHTQDGLEITLAGGQTVPADLVILSIGVRPNSALAKKAGLELNARGGVKVDAYMRTSAPSIYAVGDVVEVDEFISRDRTMIPLAGPANKQARICADNIAAEDGAPERYEGTQGSCVVKVFDLTAAATGLTERSLRARGWTEGKEYRSILINQKSHAGYYPGAVSLLLKLLFGADGKILGAQIVGREGVAKRIDTIATVIRLQGDVGVLRSLELAYAPPYSSAKDPVNMLGFVADNVRKGLVSFARYDALDAQGRYTGSGACTVLDVRSQKEYDEAHIAGATLIPLEELRDRLCELDKEKLIVVYCRVGVRAYNAARILMQKGFERVQVYPGGIGFYQALYYDAE